MTDLSHSSGGVSPRQSDATEPKGSSSELDSAAAVPLVESGESRSEGESARGGVVDRSGAEERGRVWMRFVGVGMEIAMYTIVLGGMGHWLDSRLASEKPFLTALFGLVGFCFGMYRLIRMAMLSQKQSGA